MWGNPVFNVGDNRMFAAMSDGHAAVSLRVKLTTEAHEIALHFAHVRVSSHVGRYGWVTADVSDGESHEALWNGFERAVGAQRRQGCARL